MKTLLLMLTTIALVFGSASAEAKHKTKHRSSITTGASSFSDRPQSAVSNSSGQVTHSNEQAKGLVPGNTSADGGLSRNIGR